MQKNLCSFFKLLLLFVFFLPPSLYSQGLPPCKPPVASPNFGNITSVCFSETYAQGTGKISLTLNFPEAGTYQITFIGDGLNTTKDYTVAAGVVSVQVERSLTVATSIAIRKVVDTPGGPCLSAATTLTVNNGGVDNLLNVQVDLFYYDFDGQNPPQTVNLNDQRWKPLTTNQGIYRMCMRARNGVFFNTPVAARVTVRPSPNCPNITQYQVGIGVDVSPQRQPAVQETTVQMLNPPVDVTNCNRQYWQIRDIGANALRVTVDDCNGCSWLGEYLIQYHKPYSYTPKVVYNSCANLGENEGLGTLILNYDGTGCYDSYKRDGFVVRYEYTKGPQDAFYFSRDINLRNQELIPSFCRNFDATHPLSPGYYTQYLYFPNLDYFCNPAQRQVNFFGRVGFTVPKSPTMTLNIIESKRNDCDLPLRDLIVREVIGYPSQGNTGYIPPLYNNFQYTLSECTNPGCTTFGTPQVGNGGLFRDIAGTPEGKNYRICASYTTTDDCNVTTPLSCQTCTTYVVKTPVSPCLTTNKPRDLKMTKNQNGLLLCWTHTGGTSKYKVRYGLKDADPNTYAELPSGSPLSPDANNLVCYTIPYANFGASCTPFVIQVGQICCPGQPADYTHPLFTEYVSSTGGVNPYTTTVNVCGNATSVCFGTPNDGITYTVYPTQQDFTNRTNSVAFDNPATGCIQISNLQAGTITYFIRTSTASSDCQTVPMVLTLNVTLATTISIQAPNLYCGSLPVLTLTASANLTTQIIWEVSLNPNFPPNSPSITTLYPRSITSTTITTLQPATPNVNATYYVRARYTAACGIVYSQPLTIRKVNVTSNAQLITYQCDQIGSQAFLNVSNAIHTTTVGSGNYQFAIQITNNAPLTWQSVSTIVTVPLINGVRNIRIFFRDANPAFQACTTSRPFIITCRNAPCPLPVIQSVTISQGGIITVTGTGLLTPPGNTAIRVIPSVAGCVRYRQGNANRLLTLTGQQAGLQGTNTVQSTLATFTLEPGCNCVSLSVQAQNICLAPVNMSGYTPPISVSLIDPSSCVIPTVAKIDEAEGGLNVVMTNNETSGFSIGYKKSTDNTYQSKVITSVSDLIISPLDPCTDYDFVVQRVCCGSTVQSTSSIKRTTGAQTPNFTLTLTGDKMVNINIPNCSKGLHTYNASYNGKTITGSFSCNGSTTTIPIFSSTHFGTSSFCGDVSVNLSSKCTASDPLSSPQKSDLIAAGNVCDGNLTVSTTHNYQDGLTVSWTYTGTAPNGYKVFIRKGTEDFREIANVSSGTKTFTDKNIPCLGGEQKYEVMVQANCCTGTKEATVFTIPCNPPAITCPTVNISLNCGVITVIKGTSVVPEDIKNKYQWQARFFVPKGNGWEPSGSIIFGNNDAAANRKGSPTNSNFTQVKVVFALYDANGNAYASCSTEVILNKDANENCCPAKLNVTATCAADGKSVILSWTPRTGSPQMFRFVVTQAFSIRDDRNLNVVGNSSITLGLSPGVPLTPGVPFTVTVCPVNCQTEPYCHEQTLTCSPPAPTCPKLEIVSQTNNSVCLKGTPAFETGVLHYIFINGEASANQYPENGLICVQGLGPNSSYNISITPKSLADIGIFCPIAIPVKTTNVVDCDQPNLINWTRTLNGNQLTVTVQRLFESNSDQYSFSIYINNSLINSGPANAALRGSAAVSPGSNTVWVRLFRTATNDNCQDAQERFWVNTPGCECPAPSTVSMSSEIDHVNNSGNANIGTTTIDLNLANDNINAGLNLAQLRLFIRQTCTGVTQIFQAQSLGEIFKATFNNAPSQGCSYQVGFYYQCTPTCRSEQIVRYTQIPGKGTSARLIADGGGTTGGDSTSYTNPCPSVNINEVVMNVDSGRIYWTPIPNVIGYVLYVVDSTIIDEQGNITERFGSPYYAPPTDSSMTFYGLKACSETKLYLSAICSDTSYSDLVPYSGFVTQPNCPKPSIITARNIQATTASLDWVDLSRNPNYIVRYRKKLVGTSQGSTPWTYLDRTTPNIQLENLDINTEYEVEVASLCCGLDTSLYIATTIKTDTVECLSNIGITAERTIEPTDGIVVSIPPMPGITELVLYLRDVDSLSATLTPVVLIPNEVTIVNLNGLLPNATYELSYTFVCANGLGTYGFGGRFEPKMCSESPILNTFFATGRTTTSLSFAWDAGNCVHGYFLRSTPLDSLVYHYQDANLTTSDTIVNLVAGKTYLVALGLICCNGDTSYSASIEITTIPYDCEPVLLSREINSNGDFNFHWALTNADYYLFTYYDDVFNKISIITNDTSYIPLLDPCKESTVELTPICSDFQGTKTTIIVNYPCQAPFGISETVISPNEVRINWNGVNNINYIVDYQLANSNNWTSVVTDTNSVILALSVDSLYEYRLRSVCCSQDTSDFTDTKTVKISNCQDISIEAIDYDRGIVRWNQSPSIDGYMVVSSIDSIGAPEYVQYIRNPNVEAYIGYLDPCLSYKVSVSSYCAGLMGTVVDSIFSGKASCAAPTNILVSKVGYQLYAISWNEVRGADSYILSYRSILDSTFVESNVNGTYATVRDMGIYGAPFVIKLKSICCGNEYSNETTFVYQPDVSCDEPENLQVSSMLDNQVRLSWTPNGLQNYYLTYGTGSEVEDIILVSTLDSNFVLSGLDPCKEYWITLQSQCSYEKYAPFANVPDPILDTLRVNSGGCIAPEFAYAVNITDNGATIKWAESLGATTYTVRYKLSGTTVWSTVSTSQDSVNITGLLSLKLYDLQVISTCCNGLTDTSMVTTFETVGCEIPLNLQADFPTSSTIYAYWSPVRYAQFYQIQYRRLGYNNWQTVNNIVTPYTTIGNLLAGTTYIVRVRANCGNGYTNWSNLDTTTTDVCNAPTNVLVTSVTTSSFALTWDVQQNAVSYDIHYRVVGVNGWRNIRNIVTNTHNITGLQQDTDYEFQVLTNCTGGGNSDWSAMDTVMTCTCGIPLTPTFSDIAATNLKVTWTRVHNATTYGLRYRRVGVNSWTTINNLLDTTRTITNLLPNTLYEFSLRSVCGSTHSIWNVPAQIRTLECLTPSNTHESNILLYSFRYNWDAVPNAVSYRVRYRAIGANNWHTVSNINTLYRDLTNLNTQTSYEVQVQTDCGNQNSGWSNVDTVTTLSCQIPSNTQESNVLVNTFTYNWNSVPNAASYRLRYRAIGANSWHTISNINALYRDLTNLNPQTSYEIQTQTDCGSESSGWSNLDTVTTIVCASPTNIIASNVTSSGFTISWNAVAGATEYQIRYKRSNQNNWQTISNIMVNSRQITGLQSSTTYQYEVRSKCDGDWSGWSNTQSVTTLGIRQSGETIVEQLKIQLYPNPSKGVFNLQIESAEIRDLKVTIFDVAGRLIFENNITLREGLNEYPYNITGISSGMYFLEVGEGDTMKRIKLVIE